MRHHVGFGQLLFSSYPLEYYLWNTPGVHQLDSSYRLYRALGELAGVRRRFWADDPVIQVGWFEGAADSIVWLINHSWEPRVVSLEATSLTLSSRWRAASL